MRFVFISLELTKNIAKQFETLQENVNMDFWGEGWNSSKKVEKMVSTFFSYRPTQFSFGALTIIFFYSDMSSSV